MLKHKGIRPTYPLEYQGAERVRKFHACYLEYLPEGGFRVWTKKMLKSGCGGNVSELSEGVTYCPHCREYFSNNQFEEVDDGE